MRAPTNARSHTHTSHPLPFPGLWLPPCLSFWLFLFQQSQLITPYCCRQLQTTTNLEFHYSKLFHMCIQGPGRLGWPRFRKEQPPIGTHPHPANTAILPSFFFFPSFSLYFFLSPSSVYPSSKLLLIFFTPPFLTHPHLLSIIMFLYPILSAPPPPSPAPHFHPSTAYTTCTMTLCSGSTVWLTHKNITKDFTVGLMGEEVQTGKTKLPATHRLIMSVCVCAHVCYEYVLGQRLACLGICLMNSNQAP